MINNQRKNIISYRINNSKMFLPKTRIMFPQGRNDFKEIVTNYYYIDKTLFIQEWWYSSDFISLFARPRCFGKTLCMSCVDYFFSDRYYNTRNLFENLEISKCHPSRA